MCRPRALTICVENPSVIPGRIQIEDIGRTVHPGGIFRFCRNSRKLLFYLSTIISARLFPRGKGNNAQDGGFKTRYSSKPFVT